MPLMSDTQLPCGGRLKGRDRGAFSVSTKLTSEELDSIVQASRNSGKAIGEWAREALLSQARGATGRLSHEHLMVEIAGIQLLLMNTLAPIACGETMSMD